MDAQVAAAAADQGAAESRVVPTLRAAIAADGEGDALEEKDAADEAGAAVVVGVAKGEAVEAELDEEADRKGTLTARAATNGREL